MIFGPFGTAEAADELLKLNPRKNASNSTFLEQKVIVIHMMFVILQHIFALRCWICNNMAMKSFEISLYFEHLKPIMKKGMHFSEMESEKLHRSWVRENHLLPLWDRFDCFISLLTFFWSKLITSTLIIVEEHFQDLSKADSMNHISKTSKGVWGGPKWSPFVTKISKYRNWREGPHVCPIWER